MREESMKKFSHLRRAALVATVAACAIAVPASARDGEGYAGVDLGLTIPMHTKIAVYDFNKSIVVNNKNGPNFDAFIGYDWGIIRTEAEVGHQEFDAKSFVANAPAGYANVAGGPRFGTFDNASGKTKITTAMANALLDFGGNGGVGFYAGVGAGYAWMKDTLEQSSNVGASIRDSDGDWAWQGVAGVRVPLSESIELGLKY
jgi:OOP family OmpA-OmpF porin